MMYFFVIINLGLDPDPHCIRTQQQAGSGSGFSKIPESGFSDYGSETLVRIQIRTENRIQTRTESRIQIRSTAWSKKQRAKRLKFQMKNERQELRAWSRCCVRVSSLSSSCPPPLPWRRQPLAAPHQPSTRTQITLIRGAPANDKKRQKTVSRSCKS
jgi:hypothetical protein